jgi:E3 ubiquitin-protein ligase DRIP
MQLPTKFENRDQKTDKSCASQSTNVASAANKTENQDLKKTRKTSAKQSTRAATSANRKQVNMMNNLISVPSHYFMSKLRVSFKNGLF